MSKKLFHLLANNDAFVQVVVDRLSITTQVALKRRGVNKKAVLALLLSK